MYTIDELVEEAIGRGVVVTARQIEEWHRDGLLPAPVRTPIPGRRGRGPYRFPSPAPDAVVALGRWRRLVDGSERAKVWLWLEGFDYAGDYTSNVLAGMRALWEEFRGVLPSLPPVDDAQGPLPREAILDELDRGWTAPLAEHLPWGATQGAVAFARALLGLHTAEEWAIDDERAQADHAEGGASVAHADAVRAMIAVATTLPTSTFEAPIGALPALPTVLAAVSLPQTLAAFDPSLRRTRRLWAGLCRLAELRTDPELASRPDMRAALEMLRAICHFYYRHDPIAIAQSLAICDAFIPPEVRRFLDGINEPDTRISA